MSSPDPQIIQAGITAIETSFAHTDSDDDTSRQTKDKKSSLLKAFLNHSPCPEAVATAFVLAEMDEELDVLEQEIWAFFVANRACGGKTPPDLPSSSRSSPPGLESKDVGGRTGAVANTHAKQQVRDNTTSPNKH